MYINKKNNFGNYKTDLINHKTELGSGKGVDHLIFKGWGGLEYLISVSIVLPPVQAVHGIELRGGPFNL